MVIVLKYSNLFFIFSAIYTLLLLIFSNEVILAARHALSLCYMSLIPSLFPFFICSKLLLETGGVHIFSKLFSKIMKPLFGLSGESSVAMIVGFISGYPIGAKTATDLFISGNITKSEAEKLLAFCNNCGPMFIIGSVGTTLLSNSKDGLLLYLSHIISSFCVAIFMRNIPCTTKSTKRKQSGYDSSFGEAFSDAISTSVTSMLKICGFVLFFAILMSFIEMMGIIKAISSLGLDYTLIKTLFYGFFECAGGCVAASNLKFNKILVYMLLSSILCWSGISVHLQVLGIIKKAKLSPKLYFKGKALMAIISPVITYIVFNFKKISHLITNYPLMFVVSFILIICTLHCRQGNRTNRPV